MFFTFGCAGSSLLHGLFFSCGEWGLLSSCSGRAQQLRLLGSKAGVQQPWRLAVLWHVGSSGARDRTQVSCTGRRTLSLSYQRNPILTFWYHLPSFSLGMCVCVCIKLQISDILYILFLLLSLNLVYFIFMNLSNFPNQEIYICIISVFQHTKHSWTLWMILFIYHCMCGMWDISSPTRDWICALCSGSTSLKH